MIVAIPVTHEGLVGERWGRTRRLAVAVTSQGAITAWQEHEVGWDVLHDEGGEGAHHARVVRFLRDEHVEGVVVRHMGAGMTRMLTTMGIVVSTGAQGDAKAAVRTALL